MVSGIMKVYGNFRCCVAAMKLVLLCLSLTHLSDAIMWIQPGMNHVVTCCDVVSYNATRLEMENNKIIHNTVILNDTPVANLDDYQPPNLEATTLTLPAGAAILPLVPSLNFQPHRWYNICFKHRASAGDPKEQSTASICFPVRPCECDCDERLDEAPWLRILVNASLKTDTVHVRLLSTFSPDTPSPLRIRYNLVLQSDKYYELCNKLDPPSVDEADEKEREQYRLRLGHCKREPPPIEANQINPSEAFQIQKTQVGGLPFYVLITINMTDSRQYWAQEIVHKLDPVKVDDEDGSGNFGQWITLPLPTPRIEGVYRPILDWDEVDSERICPLINKIDCTKSSTCSGSGTGTFVYAILITVVISRLVSLKLAL